MDQFASGSLRINNYQRRQGTFDSERRSHHQSCDQLVFQRPKRVRVRVPLGISYDSDPKEAIDLCLEAAQSVPRTLQVPNPKCLVVGFGDNAIEMELRFWIDDPSNGVGNEEAKSFWRFGIDSSKTESTFPFRREICTFGIFPNQ